MARPRLPTPALKSIVAAEAAAAERLGEDLAPYLPSSLTFIFNPVEINAGCWKVIDHLTVFAEALFDCQAHEYSKTYPDLIVGGELLETEIGPEIEKRTKLQWTKWETAVDLALQSRWRPEYYRAYVEEGNRPGSEDQRLLAHFTSRLGETVSGRVEFWKNLVATGDRAARAATEPQDATKVTATIPRSIGSSAAVQAVREYMDLKGWDTTQFAIQAQTSDRTIRKFFKTGRLRRSTFDGVATAVGVTREQLLRGDIPKDPDAS
jgi:hypothetical protein